MNEQRFHTDVLPLKDKIFRLALRITLNHQEAEDITQETLIRIWEKNDEWDQIESMEAYALSIGRRLSIDHTRKVQLQARKEPEVIAAQTLMLSPTPEPDERVEMVHQLIDQLPEVQRTIIQLRDIEGLRYDEIAQATGLTETQVKVYLFRARKKIKEFL